MRLKLDENLGPAISGLFRASGHDVDTVRDEGLAGATDDKVFAKAGSAGRVLVTLDLDFSNPLRFGPSNTPGIIVLRPARPVMEQIRSLAMETAAYLGVEDPLGRIWIVEPGRIRIHTPEP